MSEIIPIAENAESKFELAVTILQRVDGFDEKISTYLSFRACYFSINDSLRMAMASKKDLENWYLNNDFHELDTVLIKDFQKLYHRQALTIQYTRNYRMVIQKDYEIVAKSLDPECEMTKFEESYLTKMRGTYSPDQLVRLAGGLTDDTQKAPLNFLQVVMMANNERSIKIGQKPFVETNPAHIDSGGNCILGEVCP